MFVIQYVWIQISFLILLQNFKIQYSTESPLNKYNNSNFQINEIILLGYGFPEVLEPVITNQTSERWQIERVPAIGCSSAIVGQTRPAK